jgi:hypothetical protein
VLRVLLNRTLFKRRNSHFTGDGDDAVGTSRKGPYNLLQYIVSAPAYESTEILSTEIPETDRRTRDLRHVSLTRYRYVCTTYLMTDSRIWSFNSMKLVKGFREYKKVKLSLCLTNEALCHEGVRGSGCTDPRFLHLGH